MQRVQRNKGSTLPAGTSLAQPFTSVLKRIFSFLKCMFSSLYTSWRIWEAGVPHPAFAQLSSCRDSVVPGAHQDKGSEESAPESAALWLSPFGQCCLGVQISVLTKGLSHVDLKHWLLSLMAIEVGRVQRIRPRWFSNCQQPIDTVRDPRERPRPAPTPPEAKLRPPALGTAPPRPDQ